MKFKALYTLPIKQSPAFSYIPVGWVGIGRTFEADSPTDQDGLASRPCWVRLYTGGYVCVTTEAGVSRAEVLPE